MVSTIFVVIMLSAMMATLKYFPRIRVMIFRRYRSRRCVKILRHDTRFPVRSDGFAPASELYSYMGYNVDTSSYATIIMIDIMCWLCPKRRLSCKMIDNTLYIRANQGHCLRRKVISGHLATRIFNSCELKRDRQCSVTHGTYKKWLPLIKNHGLSRMSRMHIHFALPNEKSGARSDVEVILRLKVQHLLDDGFELYLSENNVVLCPGAQKDNFYGYQEGTIPFKYFDAINV
jgi:RNA:NAD 2'-phosphotransferase (TPT1/KptA family)